MAEKRHPFLILLTAFLVLALAGLAAERILTEFRLRKIRRYDSIARLALENETLRHRLEILERQQGQGRYSPPVAVTTLDDQPANINLEFDSPTLVFFLSCTESGNHNRENIEAKIKTADENHEYKSVVIVTGSREAAKRLKQQAPPDIPCYLDETGISPGGFGVSALPAAVLVASGGRVLLVWQGPEWERLSESDLKKSIQEALQNEKKPAVEELVTLEGLPRRIDDLKGQAGTAIFLFSGDCETCDAEAAEWGTLINRLETLEYNVCLVCMDGFDKAAAFAKSKNLKAQVLLDKSDVISKRFGIAFTPCRLILNGKANVEYREDRQLLPEQRLAVLKQFIAGKEFGSGEVGLQLARKVFPEAKKCVMRRFEGADLRGNDANYYEVYGGSRQIGFARVVHREIACDVCSDVDFIVGVDMTGRIKGVAILSELDDVLSWKRWGILALAGGIVSTLAMSVLIRLKSWRLRSARTWLSCAVLGVVFAAAGYGAMGIALPRITLDDFARQLEGGKSESQCKLKADGGSVQAITGATKSSREITEGVIETLRLLGERETTPSQNMGAETRQDN